MYCNQCGNLIPDKGVFCTFCGAKSESSVPAKTEPTASEAVSAAPVEAAAPTASLIEAPSVEKQPVQPKKKEKHEKYYTGKQIALCLAVAGIMAAAAGVFAGLYFSVI